MVTELWKDNKLTQSAFEVIESDDVKSEVLLDDPKSTDLETKPEIISADIESGDSESTDDTVDTSELPELIEIENPDEPKPKEKEPEEAIDETPAVPGTFEIFEGSGLASKIWWTIIRCRIAGIEAGSNLNYKL